MLGRPLPHQQQQLRQVLQPPQWRLRGTAAAEQLTASNGAPTIQEQHNFPDAAKNFNFARVRALVLAKPPLINCQLAGRWSALHQAAGRGDMEIVQFLLDHGASTTVRTRDGLTPAEVAQPNVLDLLLAAMPTFTNEEGTAATQVTSDEALESVGIRHFSLSSVTNEDQCHICLQDFAEGDEIRSLPCNHSFHVDCVDTWLKQKSSSCPTCRATLSAS